MIGVRYATHAHLVDLFALPQYCSAGFVIFFMSFMGRIDGEYEDGDEDEDEKADDTFLLIR